MTFARLVFAALVATYVASRTLLVPFTHDESFSYLQFVSRSYGAILSLDGPEQINNHVLNSVLARAASSALGPSEWALRLPNAISFLIYLLAAETVTRRCRDSVVHFATLVMLLAQPLIIELFSLERGYGLGLAGLLSALALITAKPETPARGRAMAILAGVAAGLALAANIVFFVPVGAAAVVMIARQAARERTLLALFLLPVCLFAAALVPRVLVLEQRNQFYFGGRVGFVHDTVGSLLTHSTRVLPTTDRLGAVLFCGIGLAIVACLLLRPVPSAPLHASMRSVAGPIAAISAVMIVLLHSVSRKPFPVDRMAAFFIPLTVLVAGALADRGSIAAVKGLPNIVRVFAVIGAIVCSTNLVVTSAHDQSSIWPYDADTRNALTDLERIYGRAPRRITLGVTWLLEPAVNYYRVTTGKTWLAPVERYSDRSICNALYVNSEEAASAMYPEFQRIRCYARTNNCLLVRRLPGGDSLRENGALMGSIDAPREGGLVAGDLVISGWARTASENLTVTVLVDGVPRTPASMERFSREDVCRVVSGLSDCSQAGYRAIVKAQPGDAGEHDLSVVFTSRNQGVRHYPPRRFIWGLKGGRP